MISIIWICDIITTAKLWYLSLLRKLLAFNDMFICNIITTAKLWYFFYDFVFVLFVLVPEKPKGFAQKQRGMKRNVKNK